MPGGDGTGPLGMGPMTGRRSGYCAGTNIPEYDNSIPRGFRGQGRGLGFGRRRRLGRGLGWLGAVVAAAGLFAHNRYVSKEDEKAMLTEQVKAMEEALANMKERLSEIERGG